MLSYFTAFMSKILQHTQNPSPPFTTFGCCRRFKSSVQLKSQVGCQRECSDASGEVRSFCYSLLSFCEYALWGDLQQQPNQRFSRYHFKCPGLITEPVGFIGNMCRSSLCTCGQFLMGCSVFSKKLNKRADGQQDPLGCLTSHQPSSPVNVFPLYRQMLTAGPARQVFDFPCLLWLFLSFGNPDLVVLFFIQQMPISFRWKAVMSPLYMKM